MYPCNSIKCHSQSSKTFSLYFIPITHQFVSILYTKAISSCYLIALRRILIVSELFTPYTYDIDTKGLNFVYIRHSSSDHSHNEKLYGEWGQLVEKNIFILKNYWIFYKKIATNHYNVYIKNGFASAHISNSFLFT